MAVTPLAVWWGVTYPQAPAAVLVHCTDQVTPQGVASLVTDALTAACPVVAMVVGGCTVNAIDAGAVIVVVAEAAFATSAGLRL